MAYGTLDLRLMVRQFARNAMDSTAYTDAEIDVSLQRAMDEYLALTKQARTFNAVTLTAGTSTVPAMPSGFLPEFRLKAYLTLAGTPVEATVQFTDVETLLNYQAQAQAANGVAATGVPRIFACPSTGATICFPIPDKAGYALNLEWSKQMTAWAPGQTGPTSFVIPDDGLRIIATSGAPGFLQMHEPRNRTIAQGALAEFRAAAQRIAARGAGSTNPSVLKVPDPCFDGRVL